MRRGEIRLVDLDPTRGSEADKTRPAVIVSTDAAVVAAAALIMQVQTIISRNIDPVQSGVITLGKLTAGMNLPPGLL